MTSARDLFQEMNAALYEKKDSHRAAQIAQEIFGKFPNSKEATLARGILMDIDSGRFEVEHGPLRSSGPSRKKVITHSPTGSGSRYATARFVSSFLQGVGWLLVAGGVLLAAYGLSLDESRIAALAGGAGVAWSGLLLIVQAQLVHATVDSAQGIREILQRLERARKRDG